MNSKFALLTILALPLGVASAAEATAISPVAGLFQILLGLAAVLTLMAVAAWLFKKIGPVNTGNQLPVKVIGGVSVGNRERIMVVEVADQWIVVGITAQQINTLSTMPKQEKLVETSSTLLKENQFSSWLKRTMDKRSESP
jgi:flagellar protein FliO/FliZ